MKLRAPPGCTAISHRGEALNVAADGTLEADEGLVEVLLAHGFVPLQGEVSADDAFEMPPDDELDTLNRRDLFALLRKKGVRVSLPITNADLRAAAKRALSCE